MAWPNPGSSDNPGPFGKFVSLSFPTLVPTLKGVRITGANPLEGSGVQKGSIAHLGPGSQTPAFSPPSHSPDLLALPSLSSLTHGYSPSSGSFSGHIQSCCLLQGTGGEPKDVRVELLQNVF